MLLRNQVILFCLFHKKHFLIPTATILSLRVAEQALPVCTGKCFFTVFKIKADTKHLILKIHVGNVLMHTGTIARNIHCLARWVLTLLIFLE